MSQKIRFPKVPDVEYLDILKNKGTARSYKPKEVIGMSWRDLQYLVGKEIGPGNYRYSLKVVGEDIIHSGSIRALGQMPREEKTNDSSLKNEIENLKRKLDNVSKDNGISVDVLISLTKQGYETQITFLNLQLQQKESFITKLENKIDSLENELNEADAVIEDLKSKTGINQYLEIAQTFLKSKMGAKSTKLQSLEDSNPNDIPKEIINLLGIVQWSEVEQPIIDNIVFYLNEFIPKLPLKGK
jgi:chromosome segregation ATPase